MKQLIRKTALCLALACPLAASPAIGQSSAPAIPADTPTVNPDDGLQDGWWSNLPKEKKALYTNVGIATFITLYGLADWDYGSGGFHSSDEGWFEADSKYGGADKVGHFWATYALSDALTGLYKHWGYESTKASNYGALSAWAVQAFMEIGDATSETQGWDWGDITMNTIGALTSIVMERYPELDRKIDFRVEYEFNVAINGIFDDYSNQYYAMVLKLDGFDALEHTWLQWVELHGGYYSRGYDSDEVDKDRAFYAGITFNFSRFFAKHDYKKTSKALEYIQIPYTVPKVSGSLD